ncbi:hypothetical protein [Achromobacter aloeverae]
MADTAQISNVAFYAKLDFWQMAIAGAALFLSQLPPVRAWFGRARLSVEPYSRIALHTELGHPHIQMSFLLTNTGRHPVRVERVKIKITRDEFQRDLQVQSYLEKSTDTQALLFTPFTIPPGGEWTHIVNCFNHLPRDAQRLTSQAVGRLRSNVIERVGQAPRADNGPMVEGDTELVTPLTAMFDAAFSWSAGEYSAELSIETNRRSANTSSKFRFTLFESESEALRLWRDEIKYGNGVWFTAHHLPKFVFVEIQRA